MEPFSQETIQELVRRGRERQSYKRALEEFIGRPLTNSECVKYKVPRNAKPDRATRLRNIMGSNSVRQRLDA